MVAIGMSDHLTTQKLNIMLKVVPVRKPYKLVYPIVLYYTPQYPQVTA